MELGTPESHTVNNMPGKTVHFIVSLIYERLPIRPRNQGSNPSRTTDFPSPRFPDQLWGPPSLLSNRYWGLLPGDTVALM
jgi:hypothetical protein